MSLKINRGSEWHKWDLHLHTASSYDYDYKNSDADEKLIEALRTNGISAIAITDHFVIDKERINHLRDLAKDIIIFPGVELRTDKGDTNIHVILIFDNELDLVKLTEDFNVFKRSKGKEYNNNERAYWDFKDIIEFAKEHRALVSIHAGRKSNGVDTRINNSLEHNQAIKEEFAKNVDIFEMGQLRDLEGYRKHVFPSIGIKPMIICSDNHNPLSYNPICGLWIKSELTFDGLRQILFEPESRICIQESMPDEKASHFVISKIEVKDDNGVFGNQELYLSENLNTIIGGKSSGKSLLLTSIAKSIDKEKVDSISERLGIGKYDFNYQFKVYWKDGEVDELGNTSSGHHITYIPQLYINYLAEKNNRAELNSLINNILLQDIKFSKFFNGIVSQIRDINNQLVRKSEQYIHYREDVYDAKRQLKEIGGPKALQDRIATLSANLHTLQVKNKLSDDEIKTYATLNKRKETVLSIKNNTKSKLYALNQIYEITTTIYSSEFGNSTLLVDGKINRVLRDLYENIPNDIIGVISKFKARWKDNIERLELDISALKLEEKVKKCDELVRKIDSLLKPINDKFSGQSEIMNVTKIIVKEKENYKKSVELQMRINNLIADIATQRIDISQLVNQRNSLYSSIIDQINNMPALGTKHDIKISAELEFPTEKMALYSQINKNTLTSNHYFFSLFENENKCVNFKKIPEFISKLTGTEDTLVFDDAVKFNLNKGVSFQDVIMGLIRDGIQIEYNVTYRNDDLLRMSPGKKGTVLLILFLQISSAEYPILIDQPEDNLDNRTIYDLLCSLVKEKKSDRQIIIVTHNANLVVATDSENIIVANQSGQNEKESHYNSRFKYINGSLETSKKMDLTILDELQRQGIREHVCDILEGGQRAFESREKKYGF